jgi:hypothetical protein
MAQAHPDTANPDAGHETSDANVRGVFAFALALAVTAAFIHFGVWLLFLFLAGFEAHRATPQYPLAAGQAQRLPPEPRLQTHPREDLRQLREQEDAALNAYGWVDRNAGVVRIPIGEAMKLIVARGLPARKDVHGAR